MPARLRGDPAPAGFCAGMPKGHWCLRTELTAKCFARAGAAAQAGTMKRFATLFAIFLAVGPATTLADPVDYALDSETSSVSFEVRFGEDTITGTMPIEQVAVALDFERAANSSIMAVLDTAHAEASFPFATQAMRGPKVLAADRFPNLTFRSNAMRFSGTTADVRGDLTIRGVTRPITLSAEIYRQRGTEAGDHSHMTVLLSGVVNRSEFGADGWNDMVGDQIVLKIRARINRSG